MSETTRQIPQQLPVQYRAFALRAEKAQDGDNQPVPLSFSSDKPVARREWGGYWWYEILGHDKGEVRTGRLDAGLTLLVNHDPGQRAGRLDDGKIADGGGRGNAYFGTTPFAVTTRQEVIDGTLRYTSVGYIIYELLRVADFDPKDDEDETYLGTYRATDWEPIEVSLVAVPADPSVGVGRSQDGALQYPVRGLSAPKVKPADADKRKETIMDGKDEKDLPPKPVDAPAQPSREQVGNEFRELDAVRQQYPDIFTEAKRDEFFTGKRDAAAAKSYVLDEMAKRSKETAALPAVDVTRDESDKGEKGIRMARLARAIAAGGKHGIEGSMRFARAAKDAWLERTLTASNLTSAGILIPEQISSEFIELLRPASVVRSFGPSLAPMPNGAFTMRKKLTGTTAQYIGENKPIPVTGVTAGNVKLSAKKLAALVPISNDLLRYEAGYSADTWVRGDLVESTSMKEDISFIRATGGEFSPRGLRWLVNAANIFTYAGDGSLTNVTYQISLLRLALRKANTQFLRPGVIMSPRTENYFWNLRDGNGNFAFREEMDRGLFLKAPYKVTTQIPENLGNGGNETEMIMADFADVVIGDVPAISIETSTEASYVDETGATVSAFQNDQTLIRLIVEHDINVKRDTSVAVLKGITLGA